MNKLLILGPGKNARSVSTDYLLKEAGKRFDLTYSRLIDARLLTQTNGPEAFIDDMNVKEFDFILPRIDSKRSPFGYYFMRTIDQMDIPRPYNAETVLVAHNKFLTLEVLSKNNIPIPKTFVTGSQKGAQKIINEMDFPMMLKVLTGYGGKGVMKVDSKDSAMSVIGAMRTLQEKLLIEEYIDNPGEDIRAFVVDGEVVSTMKRIAKKEDSRANISSGGKAISYKLGPEECEIAIKAAQAINSDICAVDMIQSPDGIQVIEVNINPGLQGIMKATGVNIPKYIMDYVERKIKR